ncbi:MAG TPA: SH3 domain-containing protein [Balneolaceae bacterium]|nr:SH3 domain-containing protein [Balneolaceae bacterium]
MKISNRLLLSFFLCVIFIPIEAFSSENNSNIDILDNYVLPEDFLDKIEGGDYKFKKEIFFEKMNFILLYLKYNKTSNKCYEVYQIKEGTNAVDKFNFKDIQGKNIQLCNYKKINNNIIVNNNKSAGKTINIVYKLKNKEITILHQDELYRYRKRLIPSKSENEAFLVKYDGSDIEHDKLLGKISVEKVYLRKEAGIEASNNGYLIKGDKVTLLDYKISGDYVWLKISYFNSTYGNIEGWVLEDEINIY